MLVASWRRARVEPRRSWRERRELATAKQQRTTRLRKVIRRKGRPRRRRRRGRWWSRRRCRTSQAPWRLSSSSCSRHLCSRRPKALTPRSSSRSSRPTPRARSFATAGSTTARRSCACSWTACTRTSRWPLRKSWRRRILTRRTSRSARRRTARGGGTSRATSRPLRTCFAGSCRAASRATSARRAAPCTSPSGTSPSPSPRTP
mmetsp:Transcript_35536/g.92334  ORF Transcript_35536/g.92334 Transcript_35536/m.92334 type:complete len:204 (+) Transcript_35536:147-758(+)